MENFHHEGDCPIRDVISHLSSKWAMLVLITLHSNGRMRFSDIQRSIGDISQRMLTVTLRSLEKGGMVGREVFAEVPPRVEYELTEKGDSFIPCIQSLVGWAAQYPEPIGAE